MRTYAAMIILFFVSMTLSAQEKLLNRNDVQNALKHIEKNYDRFLKKQIQIAEIPAPPFHEAKRARFMTEEFKRLGLKQVHIDSAGNVLGLRKGRKPHMLVISAHLDTVFPEGTDVSVQRNGQRYLGPGLVDDSLGLMNLLALIEALKATGIQTESSLLFVATVGEEGLGDLRGVKYLFLKSDYRDRIKAFISIDGAKPGRITNSALGSKRYRVTVTGPGGHSYGAFGLVNPAHALGQIIARFTSVGVPGDPKTTYNVGRLGGGTSVNSIPFEVWMEVDMRSESSEELKKLEAFFLQTVAQGVRAENLFRVASDSKLKVRSERIGDRPSGTIPDSSALVQKAKWAITALGFTPRTTTSSTDANIPISLGIPAITTGGGGTSGGAHSLKEWFDPREAHKGIQKNLLLVLAAARIVPSQN